jgi:hypothetical protein
MSHLHYNQFNISIEQAKSNVNNSQMPGQAVKHSILNLKLNTPPTLTDNFQV